MDKHDFHTDFEKRAGRETRYNFEIKKLKKKYEKRVGKVDPEEVLQDLEGIEEKARKA